MLAAELVAQGMFRSFDSLGQLPTRWDFTFVFLGGIYRPLTMNLETPHSHVK